MTDPKKPNPPTSLSIDLTMRLSEEEKAARDREIQAQADRFFGGLTEEERARLGLNPARPTDPASDPKTDSAEEPGTRPEQEAARGTAASAAARGTDENADVVRTEAAKITWLREWLWAGLALAVFVSVAWWVLTAS